MDDTPMQHRRWRRRRPRTSSGRVRRQFVPRVSPDLAELLDAQAEAAGMAPGPYLEVLVCSIHDVWTPWVQPPAVPLPTVVPMDELQHHCANFSQEELYSTDGSGAVPKSVRVDVVVADVIDARCEAQDASYADYLRALLRVATGFPTPQPPAAAHPRLPEGGDAGLAHAS